MVLFACAVVLATSIESLHAQTIEQMRADSLFSRAVIKALDNRDCHLALRLTEERETVVRMEAKTLMRDPHFRATVLNPQLSYLVDQIYQLQRRKTILSKECK